MINTGKYLLLLGLMLGSSALHSQYYFTGELGEGNANKEVYLSLIEDFRKSSRPYADQFVSKTRSDSLGRFELRGDMLATSNRIYSIHIDGCTSETLENGHSATYCDQIQSINFIASNRDTLFLPSSFAGQIFCTIEATNPNAADLLSVEEEKLFMAQDFAQVQSPASLKLQGERWYDKWKAMGIASVEPLTELYIYTFLSERSSLTRELYLDKLQHDSYFQEIQDRLEENYPNAPFTELYARELRADQALLTSEPKGLPWYAWALAILLLGSLMINASLYLKIRNHKVKSVPVSEKLTAQEKRIAEAILADATNKEIAQQLFISHSTVKTHINNLYSKVGVTNREELKKHLKQ